MSDILLGDEHLAAAVLRPVRGHHAFEACVERLATSIRLGVYEQGSTLPPERELAEHMGVSRATLRDAIAALRDAGLVVTRRGRGGGTVVDYRPGEPGSRTLQRPREELLDALEFRRIVEPGAAQASAGIDLGPEQTAMLRAALAKVDHATSKALHRQADSQLHLAIASLIGSPMLLDAVTTVQMCLHDMLDAIPVLDRNIEHSREQHGAIVQAILDGDGATARLTMERHCDDTAALLRGLL